MKKRSIAILAAMLATAIGTQAAVNLKPAGIAASVDSLTYTYADVSLPAATTEASSTSGTFSPGASGSLVVTVTGLYGWNNSAAMAATGDFATYLAGLSTVKIDVGSSDWGVDSASAWPSDPYPDRLNDNEVAVFTFDTSGTTGDLKLYEILRTINGTAEINDFVIYDPASNVVVATLWSVPGGPTDNTVAFANDIENGYQLLVGCHTNYDAARIDSIGFDIIPLPVDDVIAPILYDPVLSNSLVQLDWGDDPTPALLDSYNVYRSLSSNGTFSVVASDLAVSAYDDFDVTNGVTYYYKATAVNTSAEESEFGNMVSATPAIPVPTGLFALPGNAEVTLTWDPNIDYLFDGFTVYRSTQSGTNFVNIASGITTNAYTDTDVMNDNVYYYMISQTDTSGGESALSEEVSVFPSFDLVIVNLQNNKQGSTRAATNGATYAEIGSTTVSGNMKVGQFLTGIPYLSRLVLNFQHTGQNLTDAGKTTNDIDRVVLRMYATTTGLAANGNGSVVEVYASQTHPANGILSSNDFADVSFSKVTDWIGLDHASPADQWYEVDVTDAVLADLAAAEGGVNAGSSFRLQLNGDTSLTNANYLESIGETNFTIRSVIFVDNASDEELSSTYRPQLRFEFFDSRPGYVQWSEMWGSADVSDETADNDADGLNNLYEYGLDGNPTNGTVDPAVLPTFTAVGGAFEYIHPQRSDDSNLVYTVETRDNLIIGSWDSIGYTVGGTDVTGGTLDYVTNYVDTVEDQKFIRLKIEN